MKHTRLLILINISAMLFGLNTIAASVDKNTTNIQRKQAVDLFQTGQHRVFEGSHLNEVAFPLGGIGTGMVSLGGRGDLRDWEIFNRPGKGVNLPQTFFVLRIHQEGKEPMLRILEGPLTPPFREDYGHGYNRGSVPGLPRMERASFSSKYPFAAIELSDKQIPLEITLEAFNPFIPLEPEDSGIPGFVIRYRIKNLSSERIKITVVGSIINPIGFDGTETLDTRTINGTLKRPYFGGNTNELKKSQNLTGLYMSSKKVLPDSPQSGTMVLASTWPQQTYLTHWVRGEWFDDFFSFLDDLMDDGKFENRGEADPSPEGRTDMGSLGLMKELEPTEEVVLPYILTWHFPNFLNYFDRLREERGKIYRNNYNLRFKDAWETAVYLQENLVRLENSSRKFSDLFFRQTMPAYVLEAVSSQASIIRTPTCFWLDDGNFFAFEGMNIFGGCCPLNCTHVWNYAQSMAFLFPSLERSMRRTDFLNNVKPDGEMAFRTTLPLGSGKYWRKEPHPAADGQMGTIIRLYRDWQISGDNTFLKQIWPQAKKALEYAWEVWDPDKDGVLAGRQHNTFDIEFYGTSSLTGTLYLGALQAGAKMAEEVGDKAAATAYYEVYETGRQRLEELTWDGEYYVQKFEKDAPDKYQYGAGCISDQILGQWLATVAGLERFLKAENIQTALRSIYNYNFITDFRNYPHAMRTFALGNESGLVNCSWPKGNRSRIPFVYANEVWTGTEYQVASHLIYEGLVKEGLSIVKAIRDRHDGQKRNPWNEEESGNHYARAMSSWAVLTALSGYTYSAPEKRIGFDPKINKKDFRCFWSLGSGWGEYSQVYSPDKKLEVALSVAHGWIELIKFTFRLPPDWGIKAPASVIISLNGSPIDSSLSVSGLDVYISLSKALIIKADEKLEIKLL